MSEHVAVESEGARPSNWIWALAAAVLASVVATWLTGVPVATALLFGGVVFLVYAVVLAQFWEEPAGVDHDHGHAGHGDAAQGHDVPAPAQPANVAPAAAPATLVTSVEPAAVQATIPAATAPAVVASVEAQAPVEPQVPVETQAIPTGAASKPQGLTGPRGGKADNLQEIEGVGPGLEKLANELGIFHFDQIAAWGASEIAWMDGNLKGFKGRVTRDKWVAQARIIATEGVEVFRIRAKTNDY